jgi:hypothetical protein
MLAPTPSAHFGLSSTVRGIYAIRYLLFSGGSAIAFAMLERVLTRSQHAGAGLFIGFMSGLFIFRSQMRRVFSPRLLLGQTALYLARRRRVSAIPWSALKEIRTEGTQISLALSVPMLSPQGFPTEEVRLQPRIFGTTLQELQRSLSFFLDPLNRQKLPDDAHVRDRLRTRMQQQRPP